MMASKVKYRYTYILGLALLLFIISSLYQCQPTATIANTPVQFDPQEVPYPHLSDYAFFSGPQKDQLPKEQVLPYAPITPLFTDYAHKARFVWMPDSVQATVDEDGRILFPNNTVLIKTFYYPADFRQPQQNWQMVETRLLFKKQDEWEAYTYLWNEQGTDASLNLVGDIQAVTWTDEQGVAKAVDYVIPNKNQCKSCHNRDQQLLPIGPKIQHLNSAYEYKRFKADNQISMWQQSGILTKGEWEALFAPSPKWDATASASLESRALAYLEINCGHCHHPKGAAHTTGLYLSPDFSEQRKQLGICKPPVAAGKGSGAHRYSIVPGSADSSILYYRMASDDPGIMMPELGRGIAHEEGLALVKAWINSLEKNEQCD